ncbi:MAG TPA: neutral/alkaline non-lysosomal ceramidase N-terminal domain-containing protein, partial [Pirellulaceae bacterium]|nr:neutral/alkaline non-lysosomal ceramidase N-terminal domain-containing protein [Pirellulaceae bacterium]
VTPKYAVRLSGYGNRKVESEGVAQPLWVKALAIGGDDGDGPALLLTLENCGLTPAMRTAVATALAEKAKVRNERIVIAASHSHTAPALRGWAPFLFGEDIPAEHQQHIDQYTDEVVQSLVQVSIDALAARRPGRLAWGQGRVGFAANRRVLKDGQWVRFGVQADGPVDHSLPVLAARDEQGKLIAVVANYACHCTTLGGDFNKIAGDWAGFAQEMIEADHPGSVALITIGCGADANPEPRRSDLELCKQHGRALADEVKRLLAGQLEPLDPHLTCRLRHVDLPFDTLPTREQWQERTKQSGAPGYHAKQFLAKLDRGEEIPTKLSYPIAVWTFGEPRGGGANVGGAAQASGAGHSTGAAQSSGAAQSTAKRGDLAMVFLGGEVVVDYVIRLKSELDPSRLWVTAYANDVCCYIASKRILREGGYEADFSMYFYARPTRWAGEVEDLISDTIQKLVPRWFYPAVKQADLPPPKSPDEALASIKVKPGFKVELVAAEPLVEDPVAFDWGPDGRLWVVEMRDYPNGLTWNGPGDPKNVPGGRVKVLRDTDGDGRYDKATV